MESSQLQVFSATSDSAKVIDVAILSEHCHCKGKFIGQHDNNCFANYQGVSGDSLLMELPGACQIFEQVNCLIHWVAWW